MLPRQPGVRDEYNEQVVTPQVQLSIARLLPLGVLVCVFARRDTVCLPRGDRSKPPRQCLGYPGMDVQWTIP